MRNYRRMLSVAPLLLVACGGLTSSLAAPNDGVPVSLHGVNYTDRPFQYVVIDPKDASNSGGGEHIGPFSAGGIVCCYMLPKRWTPGIQVKVRATHWLPKDADGKLPEITDVYTVEVPPYVNGEVGELWVLRNNDGTVEVVSGNYQPNHPSWPGRVKGWPTPSLEFRRQRWELERKLAEESVENARTMLKKLKDAPEERAMRAWEHAKEYGDAASLSHFSGPADPLYQASLKRKYEELVASSEQRLKKIMDKKP